MYGSACVYQGLGVAGRDRYTGTMSLLAVITTIDDPELAAAISRELVERRLAACVQISSIRSVYRWDGDVQEDPELRLLIKTTRSSYPAVEALLKERHSYDLPAVVALDVAVASDEYADWVESECG